MTSDSLIIIPTYNESENIREILEAIFALDKVFHVLVVDDNSPDGTAGLVKNLQKKHPNRLFIEERSGKNGLGTAYIHGFKWALTQEYQYIYEMDADFSHNPLYLIGLYDACHIKNNDVAVGSRYLKGISVSNWPLLRICISYGASWYVRAITGMNVYDPTAGFVCYKRKVLETINLDGIRFVGYAFQIEMKYKSHIKGFKIAEVPIVFTDRVRGSSKMNAHIFFEAFWGVIAMRINRHKS